MLDHLKRKRMLIAQSITDKKNQREGMSSVERRRLVEMDLSRYNEMVNKTMQDWKNIRKDLQSCKEISGKTMNQRQFRELEAERSEERQIIMTPSVKDISPSLASESALAKEFYELSLDQKQDNAVFSPNKNVSHFYKKQENPSVKQHQQQNIINNVEEQSSHRESQQQIEDQQIKIPKIVNESHRTESNNNSDAIFFTSQFKQIMNNQLQSPQKSPPKEEHKVPPLKQLQQNKIQEKEKEFTGRFQQGLQNNPSGQSLAISNDSSLKYSLNQSAIQDIITRKLSNQLVVESLSPTQKGFFNMAAGLLLREDVKDFIQFAKTHTLTLIHLKDMKKSVFLQLQINKQLKFQTKVRQTKAQNFQQQNKHSILAKCFLQWSSLTQSKKQRFQTFLSATSLSTKQKCFKVLKMLLFDRRINHQIDMYFLSKMFQAFKNAVDSQSKKSNQKAYKLYFRHLKKRMFHSFVEGCYNARREAFCNETAINHLYYSTLGKYFTAWKETAPKEEKFVRLAVTTTNLMKQTPDHRLLHTKTFDFYEIK